MMSDSSVVITIPPAPTVHSEFSSTGISSDGDVPNEDKDNQSNVTNFSRNILHENLRQENSLLSMTSATNNDKPKKQEQDIKMLNTNNAKYESGENDSKPFWQMICPCFHFLKKEKELNRLESMKSPGLKRVMTDSDQFVCDLDGTSEIMSPVDIRNICKHLPPRAIGFTWNLTFSTSLHGFSLHNLYRKMYKVDSPTLVLIEDVKHRVFGALVSCALKVSDNFYGTSQSFIFRCRPEFQVFKWNGENFYFVQGQEDSISFGSGNGKFGLWLDGDLNKGRTEECTTFGSPPLIEEQDFIIKTVECWTFG